MSWVISVGTVGGAPQKSGGVNATINWCDQSGRCGTVACVSLPPNADKTTLVNAGSTPARQAEQVWRNVLSTLVGV